jgi:hypothetical protein
MSSRVVKLLFLASLVLLVLPAVAGASTSRVEGMAIQGDYIKDYSNIYTYLSNLCCVGNLVYGELGPSFTVTGVDPNDPNTPTSGTISDRAVGAVLGNLWDGKFGTWAIHMREVYPQLGQGDLTGNTGSGYLAVDPNTNTNQSFDLMWGKKFGTASLGLDLNRAYGRLESGAFDLKSDIINFDQFVAFTTADPDFHRNVLGIGVGAGFEMGPRTSLEGSFLYQNRTFEWKDATTAADFKDNGPSTYQIAGRIFWQWQPNVMVVPVFKYYSFDLSTKSSAAAAAFFPGGTVPATIDASLKGWQAGLAGDWTVGSNDLFVLGLTFARNKLEATPSGGFLSSNTESIMPQIFAALETHVNSWLTLRMGANKGVFYNQKLETETLTGTTTDKASGSPFAMALGAGIKLSTLQIDATLNQDFAHNLPYLISGQPTPDLFPKVTATYSF